MTSSIPYLLKQMKTFRERGQTCVLLGFKQIAVTGTNITYAMSLRRETLEKISLGFQEWAASHHIDATFGVMQYGTDYNLKICFYKAEGATAFCLVFQEGMVFDVGSN